MTLDRRTVLKAAGAAAVAPALLHADRVLAQAAQPSFLIEICLRDQLDFSHVMVAPGLARDANLRRGEQGRRAALFFTQSELRSFANNVFLTPQSLALQPHLDTIAMMELGELTYGPTHGHEAGNPIRSPGRSPQGGSGRLPMWLNEPGGSNAEGANYSSTPTPVALHNWLQKQMTPGLRNAPMFKCTEPKGATYHFGAGLSGAEPDRYQDLASLQRAFAASAAGPLSAAEARALQRGLGRMDRGLLLRRAGTDAAIANHLAQLGEARASLGQTAAPVSLALSDAERAYWSSGVPARYGRMQVEFWEQTALAFKLVNSGLVRTVGMEIDIGDVHDERTAAQMRENTAVIVTMLVRLIEQLKAAGLYDRALIVMFTADGGRAPAAGSAGDEGRNGVILAGGRVRGGYYGDIRADSLDGDGHRYRYLMPDLTTGLPDAVGTLGNDRRVPAANLWRTVMAAAGVSDATLNQFPSVAQARTLSWMLRG